MFDDRGLHNAQLKTLSEHLCDSLDFVSFLQANQNAAKPRSRRSSKLEFNSKNIYKLNAKLD